MAENAKAPFQQKTRQALLWMNLASEPLIVLYALLPFILRKDLKASLFQLAILAMLRPVLPLFSFYWSANLSTQKGRLKSNLMGAFVLARLPFLFVPWFHNTWYLIFCCAMYELFSRSGIPALIEILNINLPKKNREKTFTFYFVLSFLESIFLGFFIGGMLHTLPNIWPILCGLASLVSLTSIWIQIKVPIPEEATALTKRAFCFKRPWLEAFSLLKKDKEFAKFQIGFMIGGFGLMLMAPSLAVYYADHLFLSHSEVVSGRSIFMGIGIVLSSYFWQKRLSYPCIHSLSMKILFGFGLFPLALLLAQQSVFWLYLAFVLYGIAQSGSHLLWNLSGTLFAKTNEDSSPFSRVNILMVGMRGAIAPFLGGCICLAFGPKMTLLLGALTCLSGALYMGIEKKRASQTL